MTDIPNWLSNRAFLTPDRLAIKTPDENITFKELHEKVTKKAKQLSYSGIREKDTVAILMRNSIEMVVLIHALKYIGTVTVLLNTRLSNVELAWQIKDSESKYVITEEEFRRKVSESESPLTYLYMEELMKYPERDFPMMGTYNLNLIDTVMYTSGTTGNPKGVLQTYGNHWWSAVGSALNMGLSENDCWLALVPFFHISGLSILMRSVIYGIPVVIHEDFNEQAANDAIFNGGVTIVSVVSVMLTRMVEELGHRTYPSTFRCMLLGGGPAPRGLLEKCKAQAIPVYQTYGMTETSSQIVTLAPEYSLTKLGSAGKPLFPAQLKIEVDGEIVAPNQHGEIVVKGPNVTPGYLNREDETAKVIQDDWFYTGDIGYVDEDGFLYVLDRRSDLIISGGENIYPAEIESVLLTHPLIQEAGVTGIKDDEWGQVPIAFITSKSPTEIAVEEIIAYCKERLARYKVPTSIYVIDELPRNASKKLLRRSLISLIPE